MLTIVDYGMGNIGSIVNMLKRIGVTSRVATSAEDISTASKIILPGVGAFDAAMSRINKMEIREVLNQKALHEKIPILGICLGMQLLTESSEEGKLSGLAWIKAQTLSFKNVVDTRLLKVPHMGWNTVITETPSQLTEGFSTIEDLRFYFVHSFYVKCQSPQNSILKAHYGISFDAAIQQDNIYGAQFHPEKSHKFGMKLFENFVRLG